MSDDRLLSSVNILTPEFKAKLEALERDQGETLQFLVTPSHPDVTMEELQNEALKWVERRIKGEVLVSDRYSGETEARSLDQFLGSQS